MDRTKGRKLKKLELLRKTVHLVVSISIFSLFVCYSSSFCMIPNSLNVYFSTFLFSFLTRTLERKYMFLICNGILAFLAKTSLSSSSPASEIISINDDTNFVANEPVALPEQEQQEEQEIGSQGEEEMGERDSFVLMEQDEDLMGKKQEGVTNEEDGLLGTTGIKEDMMSGDELNKKFEEFIRKMKEEIRIEAQQQLIAAV